MYVCCLEVLTAVAGQSRAWLFQAQTTIRTGPIQLGLNADEAKCWQEHVLPIVGPEGVWVQDSTMLHATLFHASSHKVMACSGLPTPLGITAAHFLCSEDVLWELH